MTPDPTTQVTIEARDLDTDERLREVVEVPAPREPYRQRAQLSTLVAERHPSARLRSFAGGAATFLGPQHLIVAAYVALPAASRSRGLDQAAAPDQQPLFAP